MVIFMEDHKWVKRLDKLKMVLSMKRTKATLYIAVVLWVAVAAQVVINKAFQEEIQITEAFVKSDTEEMQSSLELAAEYKTGYLNDTSKKEIIKKLADSIGLIIEGNIESAKEDSRSEYYYYKQAKKATTELKVVSIEQKNDESVLTTHYIIVRLTVSDRIKSVEKYKKLLEKTLDELKVADRQITLKYEGSRKGNLTSTQKKEISRRLVEELQGEIAIEYDEGDLFTVYGYTGMLNEYVLSAGNKINLQIAITYNELTNKTIITLATPVLDENW
jgi:hypothetical protein